MVPEKAREPLPQPTREVAEEHDDALRDERRDGLPGEHRLDDGGGEEVVEERLAVAHGGFERALDRKARPRHPLARHRAGKGDEVEGDEARKGDCRGVGRGAEPHRLERDPRHVDGD